MTDAAATDSGPVPTGEPVAPSGEPAIAWPEPVFARQTWEWDDMHMPRALPRLGAEYVRVLAAGGGYRARLHALPLRFEVLVVDGYAYFASFFDVPEEELAAVEAVAAAKRRSEIARVGGWWRDRALPELRDMYREIEALPPSGASPDALAAAWERAWSLAARAWEIHFLVIVGPYQALDDLVDAVKPVVPEVSEGDILALASGTVDVLAGVATQLDALADAAAASADLCARLRAQPAPTPDDLRAIPGGATFADSVTAFLDSHGHLGHMTEDLGEPSWAVDPRRLLADVTIRLDRDRAAMAERRAARAAAADALLGQIRAALADRPVELERFEGALADARAVGWLTEGHNYWIDRMCGDRLRRFTRRIGAHLVATGVLDDAEDVRLLDRAEVRGFLLDPIDGRPLVAERLAELARWSATAPPRTIGAPKAADAGPDRFDGVRHAATDPAVVRGTGASAGLVRSIARVVHGPEDFDRVRPGDIVVARASNPGWVPLFTIAGGFVTDTGGVLSHAAVVAREFGVPAVVGTGDATSRIVDGQVVEMDGTTGLVKLG